MGDMLELLARYGIEIPDYSKPVYKYRNVQQAIDLLNTSEIWLSSPESMNDVFEFNNDLIDFRMSKSEWKNKLAEIKAFRDLPWTPEAKKKYLDELPVSKAEEAYISSLNDFRKTTGVFSCSESPNINLLWSHYGQEHRGVCLGLWLPPYILKEVYFFLKVNYIDKNEVIKVNPPNPEDKKITLMYWAMTKSAEWQYEKEIRAVFKDRVGRYLINRTSILEIYYGLKTSEEDIQKVERVLCEKNYYWIKRYRIEKKGFNTLSARECKVNCVRSFIMC